MGIGLFRPHPIRYFKPGITPFRLMSPKIRAEIMRNLNVSRLYEIPFDEYLRDMSDAEFVKSVLHEGLGVRHVVVGKDYKFGKNRCGNVESMKQNCALYNIGVTVMDTLGLHKIYGKYGSTNIRDAIKTGDVFHAAHMLSRPWIVDGIVKMGRQLGRTINFPTANLEFGDLVRPKLGVYCVEAKLSGSNSWLPSIANAGKRPTVGGDSTLLEVHIFNFNGDIYDQNLQVRFRSFIRPEKKFASFDDLKEQIQKDCIGAKSLFNIS
jgi:riboflavin kinase/FMN adenylyltransferase